MGSESGLEWGQKCVLTPKKLREIKVGWPLLKFPRMGCGVHVLSLLILGIESKFPDQGGDIQVWKDWLC